MEYTQEQVDQMIAEATSGLFTEEDLQKRVTSEVDRRVESGIQKGLETKKQKWEREYSERAKLTAEELAQKQLEERMQELSGKEKEISKKANHIEARSILAEANIPKAHYEKFIDLLVNDDAETTTSNVQNFVDVFNSTKDDITNQIKSEYSNVPKPKTGTNGTLTKDDFDKMGYGEKIKFKTENPDLYKEFMK